MSDRAAEANVRHAIKNAAAATMAAAELLSVRRDDLSPAQLDELLQRIHRRGDAIVRMVEELDQLAAEATPPLAEIEG